MMHIEVWKGSGKQGWRWHGVNKGRITCDAEGFPTKAHAVRAAKACVLAFYKGLNTTSILDVSFEAIERDDKTVLRWA